MGRLRPFWSYYGGKFRLAPHYPKPLHETIVEPFAGAAGYALRYHERKIVLIEKNPVIAEIWRFLIGTSESEIRRIPHVEHVDELPSWVPEGGRYLVGFSMNAATTMPRKSLSAGRKKALAGAYGGHKRNFEGWTEAHRESVAAQIKLVKHWRIIEGDYSASPDLRATWFVDPPYQKAGKYYPCQPQSFEALGRWCQSRDGQIMVCENQGADWLPFKTFRDVKSAFAQGTPGKEVIWYRDKNDEMAGR